MLSLHGLMTSFFLLYYQLYLHNYKNFTELITLTMAKIVNCRKCKNSVHNCTCDRTTSTSTTSTTSAPATTSTMPAAATSAMPAGKGPSDNLHWGSYDNQVWG